ncbi:MAG: PilZ domain-containing protein [gamma proteobacterium symbiont of Bathyaustriella thionipta]|nr:PilZ domain-containing protein [gamma proteobacterium symbiont of Bathyaustriella thionipta]MCU7951774.1 PilZ domain-containing protein [gamma proteobacterium symbiont of Bathyaustriella thionipta]MCU7958375.1 PilZ domain-containing protein [gamma proteobacterium symbiont of Bathyaustriella thionipta]MCU7968645.1 PilZ domain-containing protein [gamma proteobacterium symbiont of Bathyaustriella thionipta]
MKARRYTRYPTDTPFVLSINGMLGKHQYFLKDAGQGGLCFNALGCIDKGTPLHINFPLSKKSDNAEAKIAWCNPLANGHCTLGIAFKNSVTQADIEKAALGH